MTLAWYERVPKSKFRDQELANMGEGKYLGILRKAAMRQYRDDAARTARLQQSALADTVGTKPQKLREMESGHRKVPLSVCKAYCEAMGLPISILKRAGKQSLVWNGDTPSEQVAAAEPAPAKPAAAAPSKSPEERERAKAARAEMRAITGTAQEDIDVRKITGIKLKNHTECNHVAELSLSAKGTLIINIFDEGPNTAPSELRKAGFMGVRVAMPQMIVYDFDMKKKVTENNVPVRGQDEED